MRAAGCAARSCVADVCRTAQLPLPGAGSVLQARQALGLAHEARALCVRLAAMAPADAHLEAAMHALVDAVTHCRFEVRVSWRHGSLADAQRARFVRQP